MKVIFVLQVMFAMPAWNSVTNAGFSNPIWFDNYLECKVLAANLNKEAEKIPSEDLFGGRYYYMCRPSVSQ